MLPLRALRPLSPRSVRDRLDHHPLRDLVVRRYVFPPHHSPPMKSCSPVFSPSLSAESAPSQLPYGEGESLTAVPARRRMQVDRWLTVAGILFLLNIPFSYLYFKQLSDTIAPAGKSCGDKSGSRPARRTYRGQGALSIESFILPFLTIIALIAVYEYADTGRRSATHSLPGPAGRGISITEWRPLRSAPVTDQLDRHSLAQERAQHPRDCLGIMGLVFLLVFSAGQISMSKYGADSGSISG